MLSRAECGWNFFHSSSSWSALPNLCLKRPGGYNSIILSVTAVRKHFLCVRPATSAAPVLGRLLIRTLTVYTLTVTQYTSHKPGQIKEYIPTVIIPGFGTEAGPKHFLILPS